MKVVVTRMAGGIGPDEPDDAVILDLEATFPDVDFVWCETEEEKMAAVPEAEVYCGLAEPRRLPGSLQPQMDSLSGHRH